MRSLDSIGGQISGLRTSLKIRLYKRICTYIVRIPEAHADELVLRAAEAVLVDAGGHDLVRAAAVLVQAEVGLEVLGRLRARVVRRRQVRVGRLLARVLPELEVARRARHLEAAEVFRLEIAGEVCNGSG